MTVARRGRPGYDRRQILDAAVALFNEQGYDAASVSALGARLGLSKTALYHHFPSKEALLEAAVTEALDGLEAAIERAEQSEGSAGDRLRGVVRGAVQVLSEQLPAVTLLLRVRGNSDTERRALVRRRRFDQRVTHLVHEAQQQGAVRADIDASVATRLLFGMINSLVEWYRPDGLEDAARMADDVCAVAFDGVRGAVGASGH